MPVAHQIRLKVIPYSNRFQFRKFVQENTDPACKAIYTDENWNYRGIGDPDTAMKRSIIRAEQWVSGDVHTNSVESVWSLFKRSVVGTYHKLSAKHLDAYLDELEHRFNNRSSEFLFRDTLLKLVKAEKLPYAELTKAA